MLRRSSKWIFSIVSFSTLCLSAQHQVFGISLAPFIPPLIGMIIWAGFERRMAKNQNPFPLPAFLESNDSERFAYIKAFWPFWRLTAFINVVLLALLPHAISLRSLLIAYGTPWFLFLTCGAFNHIAAKTLSSPEQLASISRRFVFILFFVGTFVPFGITCILGAPLVATILVLSKIFRFDSEPMGKALVRLIFWSIHFLIDKIGFVQVALNDHSILQRTAQQGPFIYVGNHISMFDVLAFFAYGPPCTTFVKKKYAANPFLRLPILCAKFIPVDPTDLKSSSQSLTLAEERLKAGQSIIVWPEGTRSRDGKIGEFSNGIFKLAVKTKTTIVPVSFASNFPIFNHNASTAQFYGTFKLFIDILEPIAFSPQENATVRDASIQLRQITRDRLAQFLNCRTGDNSAIFSNNTTQEGL
jgi:1-acyl-sn-glycerol-3-phosphate acyltransferase